MAEATNTGLIRLMFTQLMLIPVNIDLPDAQFIELTAIGYESNQVKGINLKTERFLSEVEALETNALNFSWKTLNITATEINF